MPWPIQDAFSFSLWITHLLQFGQICAFGVVDMLQKSQRTSALRWTSLRLLVSHYTFMGRWVLWPNLKHDFKLVRATIWRKGFQPKHLINSESRWPCLCAATWKCWSSDKAKTSVLATRPGLCPFPSGHANTQSYFYHPLSLHLIALHMETGSRYMGKDTYLGANTIWLAKFAS